LRLTRRTDPVHTTRQPQGNQPTIARKTKMRTAGVVVGHYFADLMVEQALQVQLKTTSAWDESHRA